MNALVKIILHLLPTLDKALTFSFDLVMQTNQHLQITWADSGLERVYVTCEWRKHWGRLGSPAAWESAFCCAVAPSNIKGLKLNILKKWNSVCLRRCGITMHKVVWSSLQRRENTETHTLTLVSALLRFSCRAARGQREILKLQSYKCWDGRASVQTWSPTS